jgi:diguanylate cyclase (GGDEF)-like protein
MSTPCRLFFNRMKRIKLTSKLSFLIIFGITVSIGALGFYFDSFLKENFLEDATRRMLYGFYRIESDRTSIAQELAEGISFIKDDEHFLASIDLINNYQDKYNYNAVLLDEEKKLINRQLLSRVKLSLNQLIVLYDKNEELVAFVEYRPDGYYLYFVSYEGGRKILYSRREDQKLYVRQPFPEKLPVDFQHHSYYSYSSAKQGIITYHIDNDRMRISSHLSIFDNTDKKILAHIEMSHIFYEGYFTHLSKDMDLIISDSPKMEYSSNAMRLSTINKTRTLSVVDKETAYCSTAMVETLDGDFFYHVKLNKEKLLAALKKNRRQFVFLIIIVAALVLVLLHFVFSKTLVEPLELLMEQIRKIEVQDYTPSALAQTGDELETISKNVNQLAGTIREREDALLTSQKNLEHLSHHDSLTDLPNRRLFMSRLQQAIQQAEERRTRLAVLFLDLDEFKQVNDTLGHDIGDQLLVEVSARLADIVRFSGTLARIGGDEFNILLEDVELVRDVEVLAGKLLAAFKQPCACVGHELSTSVSIGTAFYPADGKDAVTLIRHADMAMYQAKAKGGNDCCFFHPDLASRVQQRITQINALKKALLNCDEFYLLHQPKVSLLTGRVEGMESLIRWQSSSLGFMRPDQFIHLAEETSLIIPLGEWVAEQAFKDFMTLKKGGALVNKVSINISAIQLLNSDIVAMITRAVSKSGILPEQIELEITESCIAIDEQKILQTLRQLRDMNIELAIDDFGTGYSSMSYLQKMPITRLKIDKSFVDHIQTSQKSQAIIQTIITLAKIFELAVTAEGIEHEEQLDFLKKSGCDEVQGYFYAKPLSLEAFQDFSRTLSMTDRRR